MSNQESGWQVIEEFDHRMETVQSGLSRADARSFARYANMGSDGPRYFSAPETDAS